MGYAGFDVTNKVCLVTGGTSGIGRAIALGLAAAGARVVAGSSSESKVEATRRELGDGHDAVRVDVADATSARAAVDHAVTRFGRLDALINAAGVIQRQPSLDVDVAEFERVVRINLVGSFVVAQAAGRAMASQTPDERGERGCVVNVASLNSFVSLTEVLAYACSKSGVMGLTRGLANEWATLGIRVNGVAPGVIPTDLNRPLIEGTDRGKALLGRTPLGRFGEAGEVVGAVIYLISPAASFTTGETIVVDGGFLARGI